jgi:hypothetical protein
MAFERARSCRGVRAARRQRLRGSRRSRAALRLHRAELQAQNDRLPVVYGQDGQESECSRSHRGHERSGVQMRSGSSASAGVLESAGCRTVPTHRYRRGLSDRARALRRGRRRELSTRRGVAFARPPLEQYGPEAGSRLRGLRQRFSRGKRHRAHHPLFSTARARGDRSRRLPIRSRTQAAIRERRCSCSGCSASSRADSKRRHRSEPGEQGGQVREHRLARRRTDRLSNFPRPQATTS